MIIDYMEVFSIKTWTSRLFFKKDYSNAIKVIGRQELSNECLEMLILVVTTCKKIKPISLDLDDAGNLNKKILISEFP